VIKTVMITIKI